MHHPDNCLGGSGGSIDNDGYWPSHDYDAPIGEAGDYGQPGIGGATKFEVRLLRASACALSGHAQPLPAQAVSWWVAVPLAQLIRDAIAKQTGVEPPAAPRAPWLLKYGVVELYESASLLSQIGSLYPGDGITSARPLIMEEYGQGCVMGACSECLLSPHSIHAADCWGSPPACTPTGMALLACTGAASSHTGPRSPQPS